MIIKMHLNSTKTKCTSKESPKDIVLRLYYRVDSTLVQAEQYCSEFMDFALHNYSESQRYKFQKDYKLLVMMMNFEDPRQIRIV